MAATNIPGLKNSSATQTGYGVEINAGVRKQSSPCMVETVPVVCLSDKAAQTADGGFFMVAAHGEVSVEHSRQPCDRNQLLGFVPAGLAIILTVITYHLYLERSC